MSILYLIYFRLPLESEVVAQLFETHFCWSTFSWIPHCDYPTLHWNSYPTYFYWLLTDFCLWIWLFIYCFCIHIIAYWSNLFCTNNLYNDVKNIEIVWIIRSKKCIVFLLEVLSKTIWSLPLWFLFDWNHHFFSFCT